MLERKLSCWRSKWGSTWFIMIKVIKQKGNFDSSILNAFGEASLILGNKVNTWKTEQLGWEMTSNWVNLDKENRLYLDIFQRETSKTWTQPRCERLWRKQSPKIMLEKKQVLSDFAACILSEKIYFQALTVIFYTAGFEVNYIGS